MVTRTWTSLAVVMIAGVVATASAADLPEIQKRGKLIATTSGNLPPVTFLNEKNELQGYDINVARFVEKHLGIPIDNDEQVRHDNAGR